MIEVDSPRVFLIGEPRINTEAMLEYLVEVGGKAWFNRVFYGEDRLPPPSEALIEFMGRLCYKSWEPGLNKNVTKIREDRGDYLLNILRSGHGSVLEHAVFNFVIHDGSRVFTAEMNRHKAGTAISEQSLRYVRLDELRFRMPPVLKPETQSRMRKLIEHVEQEMGDMMKIEELDDPDLDFAQKKIITSALRRGVPMGISTEEGWSANIRAIRHVIEMRTAKHAEEEIRIIADQIALIMRERCPLLFEDYEPVSDDPSDFPPAWVTEFNKV